MLRFAFLLSILTSLLAAQRGDKAGEAQPDPPASLHVPPAPVLSPQWARRAFRLARGFRIRLVAAEPLVEDPIAITFDARGRLWVLELRSFMPDVDGTGAQAPTSRIVVLTDRNSDGRMDESRVFLDDLVLPRALALVEDGLLVIEPPSLSLWQDTDGDGRGDKKTEITGGFQAGLRNVEHAGNGLLQGLDNWIYLADDARRLRRVHGTWQIQRVAPGGQWGLSKDDRGRLFFNYNSDLLRAHLYPPHYAVRNPHLGRAFGVNWQVEPDQKVWPIRVNPGINRGYQNAMLTADFKLARSTAACGPVIYRGDLLGADCRGNAFVCEPAGNLVRREVLTERDGRIRGHNAYPHAEFLASTDERFRPVNLANGPDGALYVVDMYRGIIQDRVFVTSYLRRQILSRKLDRPIGLGRIWKIVAADAPQRRLPALAGAPTGVLLETLGDPNGWRRDMAQRLLIARRDPRAPARLRKMAAEDARPLARLHALWTLEGLGRLDRYMVFAALGDADPIVRAAALRLAEPFLRDGEDWLLLARVCRMTGEKELRRQLVLTLGEVHRARAETALARLLAEGGAADRILRSAALSGLFDRELSFLHRLLAEPDFVSRRPGRVALLAGLAGCIVRARAPAQTSRLLELAAHRPKAWQRDALLDGVLATLPRHRHASLVLARRPRGLEELGKTGAAALRAKVQGLLAAATWGPEATSERRVDPAQSARLRRGRSLFAGTCAVCHQLDGRGLDGLAPPLLGSAWVAGPPGRLVRIVLHGMGGPVRVAGRTWNLQMPPQNTLASDREIAEVLTYLRETFGEGAGPVEAAEVERVRARIRERRAAWTAAELEQVR